jgi:hypothetical protein
MVSGGLPQQEASKLSLGKIDATGTALSGPGPVLDALLSGAADYGTAALPSLLRLWERTQRQRDESGRHRQQRRHDALHHQSQHPRSPISATWTASSCRRCVCPSTP